MLSSMASLESAGKVMNLNDRQRRSERVSDETAGIMILGSVEQS
jgi:hypothetical protein